RALSEWATRIRPGGWLMLELWNRDRIVSRFEPRRTWRASESLEVDERRDFDPLTSRLRVHYDYTFSDGQQTHHDIEVRLYTPTEIRDLLAERGLRVEQIYGSARGDEDTLSAKYLAGLARK